jgi:electron transfer flavoprotein alpha subunit
MTRRILVIADRDVKHPEDINRRLVGAARALSEAGDVVIVAAIADQPERMIAQLSATSADEIVAVSTAPVTHQDPAVLTAAVTMLLAQEAPAVVLCNDGPEARSYLPAVASAAKLGFATSVDGLRWDGEELVASRAAYGGDCWLELSFEDKGPVVLTLDLRAFPEPPAALTVAVVRTASFSVPEPSLDLLPD